MNAPLDGSIVLITGASSGIGAALARQCAGRAKALVLVARRTERLEALRAEILAAHPRLLVSVQPCDITDQAAVVALLAVVDKELGSVDVLMNNAGMGDFGVFDKVSWEKTERMIVLNVTALCHLTRLVLGPMVARGRGAILNVSSGFGLQFMPGFAVYAGTKHFVTAFTEALRLELRGTGVVVTQICPGPVTTEFESLAADFEAPKIPPALAITAEHCARAAIHGLDRGRAMVIPGLLFKTLLALGGWTPRFVMRWIYAPVGARIRALPARPAP